MRNKVGLLPVDHREGSAIKVDSFMVPYSMTRVVVILECMKLIDQVMKVTERFIAQLIRELWMQFGFVSGR